MRRGAWRKVASVGRWQLGLCVYWVRFTNGHCDLLNALSRQPHMASSDDWQKSKMHPGTSIDRPNYHLSPLVVVDFTTTSK